MGIWSYGNSFLGPQEELMINEPSVFKSLKFHGNLQTGIIDMNT